MADVDTAAILGGNAKFVPTNPLDTMQKYQNFNNSLVQQAQGIAGIANTQQSTANMAQDNQKTALGIGQNQATYVAQKIAPVLASPDPITQDTVTKIINDARANNAIDDTHVASALKAMPQNGSDADYRKYATQLLIGTLSGPDASSRILPGRVSTDTGDGTQYSTIGGPNQGIGANQVTPSGYVAGGHMPDAQKTEIVTLPDGKGGTNSYTRKQLNDRFGGGVPPGNSPMGANPIDGDLPGQPGQAGTGAGLPTPIVSVPAGQAAMQENDVKSYVPDALATNDRLNNAQNLTKALHALQSVQTGSGNEWIAANRAKMVTLLGQLGIESPRLSANDFNQAEAEKLLIDYSRKSGSAASSVAQLEASEHSNPSTVINNTAAQDFVRTNIGLERQKAAIALLQKQANANGLGYVNNAAKIAAETDKRGFAFDTYTPTDLKKMVDKMSDSEKAKFFHSMTLAQQLKMTGQQAGGQ